jgi:quercetin dioxygenase-like cupin family protein
LAGLPALGALPKPGAMHVAMSGVHGHSPAQSRPATVIRPVSCTPLKDIPGKSVTTVRVEFPPLASSPPHRHPGSVTAYVLKGTLRSQLAGEPARTYVAGETWFEPTGALHELAENPSATEAAELLAVFVADSDCGPLVIPE